MKKHRLIILFLSIASAAVASDVKKESELSISVNTMSMDYTEYHEDGDKIDSEATDSLPGFTIGYKTHTNDGLYGDGGFVDTELSHFSGDTTYIGSYQGGTYGELKGTTHNSITDAAIGYSENMTVGPGLWFVRIGMGYRLWERELLDGHNEKYYWPYGSLSTGLSGNLSPDDNIGLSAEYHRAFSPEMKSNILGTFDLGRTDGYSISIPWVHTITPSWALKFAYTYQTWEIEKSNTVSGFYEPHSESYFNIFKAALIYRY